MTLPILAALLITHFGAIGDGTTLNTAAVQAALDAAAEQGGGTVVVPAGKFLCGELTLRSHTELRIEAGGELLVSGDASHYPSAPDTPIGPRPYFLVATNATDVAITGPGAIVGPGDAPLSYWQARDARFRVRMMLFDRCRKVRVEGLTLRHSDSWTLHLKRCEVVFVRGVHIDNRRDRINTDGIDPDGCRDVFISDCRITAGDDAIVMKASDPDAPCENIVISNCVLESATTALKFGTETHAPIRNVTVANTLLRASPVGIGIMVKDGGTVERVRLNNLTLDTVPNAEHGQEFPVLMDIERRTPDSPLGAIRDVIIRGLSVRTAAGLLIQGAPEAPIEQVALQDVRLVVERTASYEKRRKITGGRRTAPPQRDHEFARLPSWCTLAHVRGVRIDGFKVLLDRGLHEAAPRHAVLFRDVADARVSGVHRAVDPEGRTTALVVQE